MYDVIFILALSKINKIASILHCSSMKEFVTIEIQKGNQLISPLKGVQEQ